jgi:hypothetical protein
MKTRLAYATLVLLVVFVCRGQSGTLQLPESPRQHSAWRPDTSVPTNILSAAETIYEQGFPDPHGCEYREIEVAVSGVWVGKVSLVKTRGWVFPEKSGTNQFAICWNGLIYPVAKVSAPADLLSEIMSSNSPASRRLGFNGGFAIGEDRSIIYANALSTRILLLLRCGETAAALTNWTPNPRMMMSGGFEGGRGPVQNNDPYLEFASDWAWAMFDRTICAHMRGDEALALATARRLAEVQPKIEAEAEKRGFTRPQYSTPDWRSKPGPYLGFLDQLPQLLADLERRAHEAKKISIIESGLTNYPDQTRRIAALIDDLDLVSARQWGQPGWVNLPEDPIVSALIQEGDPAVEPLLDCVEQDKRLTRSVGFGRDFSRSRTVIPVRDAARSALLSILQAGFGDGTADIRAYWNRYKGMNLDERCYAILNDDSAGGRWLEAAAHITQPDNVSTFPGGYSKTKTAPTNAPVRMCGEALRGKSNPSVAELMTRRALEVPANNPNAYDLSAACQMCLALVAWDRRAAEPVAQTLLKRSRTAIEYSDQDNSRPDPRMGTFMAKLTLACAQSGNTNVFEDYAAWLKTTTPEQLGFSLSESLEPLCKYPTNEILVAAAASLFGDTNSAWNKLPWTRIGFDDPVASDLANVPAFRLLLARELDRKEVCGSISFVNPNTIRFVITNSMNMSGSRGIALPADSQPTNGTSVELRRCDWIALSLASGNHIPIFNPFAPVEERDETIAKAKALLERR